MRRAIRLRKKIVFSVIAVSGIFGWIEIVLRTIGVEDRVPPPPIVARSIDRDIEFPFVAVDPFVFWRVTPGFRGDFLGKPVAINSLGLRGPEISHTTRPDRTRILCFGDSITFGYGVGDRETYAYFLEECVGSDKVEVVNCGVTGYTSFQVERRFRQLCAELPCDVATFCVGWNDASVRPVDDVHYARQVRFAASGTATAEYCYTYRLIRNLYADSYFSEAASASETNRVPLDAFRRNLQALVSQSRFRGITPVFIDLPCRKGRGAPFRLEYSAALRTTCAESGVPVIDVGVLSPTFSQASNEEYFIDSCHLSVKGHRHLAERVAGALAELGLVETPAEM
ncbi:SGNH/GDSL hydrolase family protein [Planctomycetota bacterium]